MRKSKRELFKQLEEGRRARGFGFSAREWLPERPLAYFHQEIVSSFPKGTLGYLADELNKSVELLIGQFEDAGVNGLTPAHQVTDSHKQELLSYLKRKHGMKSERLYSNDRDIGQQIQVVQEITDDLLKHLAREPRSVYQLPPRRFEELIAKILEDQGCEVTLTKQTRDGGYDILGSIASGPAPLLFLAECKRYAEGNPVGVEVVRSLYGVTEIQRVNFGMIVTSSSFTRDARAEKVRIGPRMDLKEFGDLKAWLRRYGENG